MRVQAGWGDDEKDAAASNPFYDAKHYESYSPATRRNLARLDENRIDFDLLEELVCLLATGAEDGAILVFLPGEWCRTRNRDKFQLKALSSL